MRENLTPRRDLEAERDKLLIQVQELQARNAQLERERRNAILENQALALQIADLRRRA